MNDLVWESYFRIMDPIIWFRVWSFAREFSHYIGPIKYHISRLLAFLKLHLRELHCWYKVWNSPCLFAPWIFLVTYPSKKKKHSTYEIVYQFLTFYSHCTNWRTYVCNNRRLVKKASNLVERLFFNSTTQIDSVCLLKLIKRPQSRFNFLKCLLTTDQKVKGSR